MLDIFFKNYQIILKVLYMLIAIPILFQILSLIKSITNNFITLSNSIKLRDKMTNTNRLEYRVRSSNALLSLIDTMIDNEIIGTLKTYARLQENYKNIKTPDDIESISLKVFTAIKKEIFEDNNDTVLTDEYLMRYINEQTTLKFLINTKNLNNMNK